MSKRPQPKLQQTTSLINAILEHPIDDRNEDPRSQKSLLIPVAPLGVRRPAKKDRRTKIETFPTFDDYWEDSKISQRSPTEEEKMAHTILLERTYAENLFNLVKDGVVPAHVKSDSDLFKWVLQVAFRGIENGLHKGV